MRAMPDGDTFVLGEPLHLAQQGDITLGAPATRPRGCATG